MEDNFYLCLAEKYLKFDHVSAITNVFFDDTNKQIFVVKPPSVSVKSVADDQFVSFSFFIETGPLIAIKFNSANSILAIQRTQNSLELCGFQSNAIIPNTSIHYEAKKNVIYGFFWCQPNEICVVSADSIELFFINPAKKTMKSLKCLNNSCDWFAWNKSSLAILSSNAGSVITPFLIHKPGTITKLASIQIDDTGVGERDVNTGILYGDPAILIVRTTRNRNLEVWIYLLEGPSFRKAHVLKLGYSGRVAISIIDSIIIVHHQSQQISLIFDIAVNGEPDAHNKSVTIHSPLIAGKSIKPFAIKMPSASHLESLMNVELYSANWVIFQPDIIIDVKLGFLFKLSLLIDKVNICDKARLVNFLMYRLNEKPLLLSVIHQLVTPDDCAGSVHLPVLETIFDRLNKVYKEKIDNDLMKMQALPTASPSAFKSFTTPIAAALPTALNQTVVEQSEVLRIINTIVDKSLQEKVLMAYVYSIVKHSISVEYDLSKVLIITLVGSQKIQDLQQILSYNVLHESKPLACFLLSLANREALIGQMALDMLLRLNAHEIIIEILLEQGKVVDAIRLAKQYNTDSIAARKFLDAAQKSGDKMVFHTVYNFFVTRNIRLRGNSSFLKSEQCDGYEKVYEEMFPSG